MIYFFFICLSALLLRTEPKVKSMHNFNFRCCSTRLLYFMLKKKKKNLQMIIILQICRTVNGDISSVENEEVETRNVLPAGVVWGFWGLSYSC